MVYDYDYDHNHNHDHDHDHDHDQTVAAFLPVFSTDSENFIPMLTLN